MKRHPTTAHWVFPPTDRRALPAPLRRVNLRELQARPGRFEHHLMSVGQVGVAHLEIVTASEPVFAAHLNISEEYAVPLATGDAMGDSFPFRTFLMDPDTGADVGRIKHKVNQLVLHPHGLMHFPGRLRNGYETFEFAPGMRRCGITFVCCASKPTLPDPSRELFVTEGCETEVKGYIEPAPDFVFADLAREQTRRVGVVGEAELHLLVEPTEYAPGRGGYLIVLAAEDRSPHFEGDLVYVPGGARLDTTGLGRALVVHSPRVDARPPPASWSETPSAPFAPFEDAPAGSLPLTLGALRIEAISDEEAEIRVGDGTPARVPRYWVARTLFRGALHGYALGYLETYGGFFYDDGAGGDGRLGVRRGGEIPVSRAELPEVIERIYRAIAPPSYTERLE